MLIEGAGPLSGRRPGRVYFTTLGEAVEGLVGAQAIPKAAG